MFNKYKVAGLDPKPPKKKKPFTMLVLALICVVPAFALLKTTIFSNNNNFLASDNSTKYDIVVDLGEGGRFEPGTQPEFTKMDNGKWIHKYTPGKEPIKLPRPVKDGYTFEGWLVEGDPTPKPEYSIPAWNKENINLSVKWKSATSDLLSGYEFNKKIKSMTGFDKVTEIKFINETPKLEGTDLSEKQNGYIKGSISGNVLTVACSGRIYASSNASNMFNGCSKLTKITLNNFDTSKVTTTGSMFSGCSGLTILDLGTFDTSKVLDMNSMFQECSSLTTIDVSKWDTSRVSSMYNMFNGCSSLELLDLSKLNISNVTDMCYMFSNCSKLTSEITISRVTKPDNISFMFAGCSSAADAKFIVKYTSPEAKEVAKQMVATKRDGVDHVYLYDPSATLLPGPQFSSKVKTISNFKNVTEIKFVRGTPNPDGIDLSERQDGSVKGHILGNILTVACDGQIYANADSSSIFKQFTKVKNISFDNFNTSKVINIDNMFNGCSSLTTLNVSEFDTLHVSSMYATFQNCSSLTALDVSKWNTSQVKNMFGTFWGCSNLTKLDIGEWDISQVTNMAYIFNDCTGLITLNVSKWDTSKVTTMHHMFNNCSNLTTLDVSKWNTLRVADMYSMFEGCSKLSGSITICNPRINVFDNMFTGCSTSQGAKFIVKYISAETKNLAQNMVNTKNPEDHVYLYDPNSTLLAGPQFKEKVYNMPGFDNVTQIKFIKGNPKPGDIDLSERQDGSITASIDHDTLNIVCYGEMSANANCNEMFKSFNKITSYTFDNFNTLNVTSMQDMFCGNSSLPGIDLQKINTSKVTSMRGMFSGCSDLISMDLSILNTSKVSDMALMFTNCSKLRTLNLTGLNTSSLTTMQRMFRDCPSLTNLDFTNLDLSKVTNYTQAFKNCSDLSSEITITNTGNQNILEMFTGCSSSYNAEFWVKYSNSTAKEKARQMVATKNSSDHVYLWEPKKSGLLPGPQFRDKLKTLSGLNTATEIRFISGNPKSGVDLSLAQNGSITGYVENGIAYIASNDIIEFNRDSSYMFGGLTPSFNVLKKISFSNIDTSKVTTMESMFQPGFREEAWRLEEITGLTLFKTPNLTTMQSMFAGCRQLKSLDLSSFDTSNVTDMGGLCWEDWSLRSINVSNFNTRKNEHFNGMFNECYNLTSIDLSKWRYDSAWMMGHMFAGCNLVKTTMVINNPNIPDIDYALSWAAVEGDAEIRVDYTAGCREMAQKIVNTKGDSSYVYLGNQVSGRTATLSFIRKVALALKYGMAPPVKDTEIVNEEGESKQQTVYRLTLDNGLSAQYPKQVIEVKNGKVPQLNAPELNPQYVGQFGGYYYDKEFTKPVNTGDNITKDLTIYARW